MSKVVILSSTRRDLPGWEEALAMIREEGHEVLDAGQKDFSEEEALFYLRNADAVMIGMNMLSGNVIKEARNLKVISKPGAGVDNIDVSEATHEGIWVCNTPGSNAATVADHVIGLMICVARWIPYFDTLIRMGKGWGNSSNVTGVEIAGKTLGVVGTGHIGKAVIRRASGFDMCILANDTEIDAELIRGFSVQYVSLKELLERADFVTLHVPLTERTRCLIGRAELNSMRRTAYLLNTSRGPIIDEKALIIALREGSIAGAGLDVYEQEPLVESELFKLKNVVLTPHIAGYSIEASARSRLICAENIIHALRGRKANIVNHEVFELPQVRIKLNN